MGALRRIADDPRLGALAVLLIAMAVYLPRLGADGLAGTEGHRVIPGWELLDRLQAAGEGAATKEERGVRRGSAEGRRVGTGLSHPESPKGSHSIAGGNAPGRGARESADPEGVAESGAATPTGANAASNLPMPRPHSDPLFAANPPVVNIILINEGASPDSTRGGLAAPTMFDRLYLRKPAGMMWAEAASAAVFGRSEWSARFVGAASSIALVLVAFVFAWRWFGARAGLASGVALALTPWLWQSGRSAEIEPLHNLWVALAAFCAIDLLLGTPTVPGGRMGTPTVPGGRKWTGAGHPGDPPLRGGRAAGSAVSGDRSLLAPRRAVLATALIAATLAVAIAGAAAAKGPAGAPVLAGAILGAMLVAVRAGPMSAAALPRRAVVLMLSFAAAGAVIVPVWLAMQRAGEAPGADPVAQGAAEFLWSGPVLEILALPFAALVAALPLPLALPQAWAGSGGGGPATSGPPGRWGYPMGYPVARALGWATVIAIAIYTLIGVSNVRYVMPVAPLMAPLLGWAVVNGVAARGGAGRSLAGVFDGVITHWWWAWAVALLVGSQVYVWGVEPSRDGRSGREAGLALGAALPAGAEVWANDLVEAVPETLLYAQRAGKGVQVRWRDVAPGEVPSGVFVVLRSDADSGEADAWRAAGGLPEVLFEGAVRHYRFIVIQAP